MKATIRRKYGSPNQIHVEQLEQVTSSDDQVLIKVHTTTVNRTDCAILTGKPFIMRLFLGLVQAKQIVLGTDFAGEIVALGKSVKSFQIGDKVFGFFDTGAATQAEYLSCEAKNVYPIPANIDYKTAAASLEGAHYAYSFIHKVNIQAGQKILINGATGAIGSALLQFVRQLDVKITAICNTKNMALIESLGADKIYDYTKDDFTNDPEKYDFIFDAVGKSTFGKCKPLLKPNGIYISSELGPYAQNIFYALFSKKVIFPIPYHTEKTIPFISNHLAKATFQPLIDRTYPLDNIAEAYRYVLQGQKTGNVVILIQD